MSYKHLKPEERYYIEIEKKAGNKSLNKIGLGRGVRLDKWVSPIVPKLSWIFTGS